MNNLHLQNDDELTHSLKNNDESAFTEIYNRYWDRLYYIAHKLLKDTNAAEEIVQEVFLTLWKKRDALNIQCLNHYLSAMTRYSVYHYIASEKKCKVKEDNVALLNVAAISEINVDHKILLQIITELSNKLPEKCRLVFQYNKLQDQSLSDVAQMLNMSQKTAEGHLTKALRIIRSNLGSATSELLVFLIFLEHFKK
ncbi:RNA polymerase sigma factor [Mucilaginibacter agri]|uniref:Sigma-70 family RNA polymerase sigma factor n=1 Tax=Mucilaginibacter agri TaxID=2695265 RepID=A0A966DV72_9SPHI|nr:sigma-70 family RNA polymerase sigma factor [Mucilaginibacter agri]NCD71186.1 sigma-70 family RNA polymerase sigma factor [Mucilaginibacter agri]